MKRTNSKPPLKLIPLMDRYVYPFIRTRLRYAFTPITRIALGFFVAALAMLYAGVLQFAIYAAPPCYTYPSKCEAGQDAAGKSIPNEVHVAWQAPAYILVAVSEILASITGLELAYSKAPKSMKSFIMSLFLLTSAGGNVLGILIAPFAKDPYLPWVYFGLAAATLIAGFVFQRMFSQAYDVLLRDTEDAEEFELAAMETMDNDLPSGEEVGEASERA